MIYTIIDNEIQPKFNKRGNKNHSKFQKHLNTLRSKRSHKFYSFYNSHRWHKLSYRYRESHPLDEIDWKEYKNGKRPLSKVRKADSVDHIKPLKFDWKDRWNPRNLQSLSSERHRLKSAKGL